MRQIDCDSKNTSRKLTHIVDNRMRKVPCKYSHTSETTCNIPKQNQTRVMSSNRIAIWKIGYRNRRIVPFNDWGIHSNNNSNS